MSVLTLIIIFIASAVAIVFAYSALPSQRWWRNSMPRFPAHVTAVLAALIALKGWVDVLTALQGVLTWMSTLAVPLTLLMAAGRGPIRSIQTGPSLPVAQPSR